MSVEPVAPLRAVPAVISRITPALVPAASTALLAAGVLGLAPALPAMCAAIALSAVVHTTLLARMTLTVRGGRRGTGD